MGGVIRDARRAGAQGGQRRTIGVAGLSGRAFPGHVGRRMALVLAAGVLGLDQLSG